MANASRTAGSSLFARHKKKSGGAGNLIGSKGMEAKE
jgi:hypothetical protein